MTPQETRQKLVSRMRTWASDLPDWMDSPRLTKDEVNELVRIFDDVAFVAKEFLGTYVQGNNDYTAHVARNLILSAKKKDRTADSLDNLPITRTSDNSHYHPLIPRKRSQTT